MRTKLPLDNTHPLRAEQLEQFDRDGYLMIENLSDAEEVDLLLREAKGDRLLHERAYGRRAEAASSP